MLAPITLAAYKCVEKKKKCFLCRRKLYLLYFKIVPSAH